MANAMYLMPELHGEELVYVQSILDNLSEEQAQNFVHIYRSRRRKPQEVLILSLIGLLGIAGIHRFLLNQVGMGLLYLLTIGLCYIGTIIDAINYQKLTFEYNRKSRMKCFVRFDPRNFVILPLFFLPPSFCHAEEPRHLSIPPPSRKASMLLS